MATARQARARPAAPAIKARFGFGFFAAAARRERLAWAVPEASTWAMMIAGFGFVGAAMRMRKTRPLTAT